MQAEQSNGEVAPLMNPDLQLVPAQKLLELLWHPDCRPSLRWLRDQQKRRRIPSVKLGHFVFFIPADVRNVLRENMHWRAGTVRLTGATKTEALYESPTKFTGARAPPVGVGHGRTPRN